MSYYSRNKNEEAAQIAVRPMRELRPFDLVRYAGKSADLRSSRAYVGDNIGDGLYRVYFEDFKTSSPYHIKEETLTVVERYIIGSGSAIIVPRVCKWCGGNLYEDRVRVIEKENTGLYKRPIWLTECGWTCCPFCIEPVWVVGYEDGFETKLRVKRAGKFNFNLDS